MRISEIMTPDPELIDPTATVREAAQRMKNEDIGALPVGGTDVALAVVARAGSTTVFLDAWTARRERMEAPPRRYWAWRMAMRLRFRFTISAKAFR